MSRSKKTSKSDSHRFLGTSIGKSNDTSRKIYQKKSLGQVFLTEDWPCRRLSGILCDSGAARAIEIGPGGGILTRSLLEAGLSVLAIEKDERFAAALPHVCADVSVVSDSERTAEALTVARMDVLRFDLKEWVDSHDGGLGVCGNIPYNISSSVMMWVLPHIQDLKKCVFMVQKEFAERVSAEPSTKAYGSLSVFAQLRAKTTFEFHVSREIFSPVPGVDSAVLSLEALETQYSDEDLKNTERLTKTAFSQRRKKMRNSISQFIKNIPEEELGIDLSRRPDSFSPGEYLELSRIIFGQQRGD